MGDGQGGLAQMYLYLMELPTAFCSPPFHDV